MLRLLFTKTGNAIWVSHLDLMRIFQRAFKRADLPLKHTQGFNPRPSVSIALPLSVGVSSVCELLDFDLDCEEVECQEIQNRLNNVLIDGVQVLGVYPNGRKIRDLALLRCRVEMEYDGGIPVGAPEAIRKLFDSDEIVVTKKTKTGLQDQNIASMIKKLAVLVDGDQMLILDALICCQNPTLNPMQLPLAVEKYLPVFKPDFSCCRRVEIYDLSENVFR